MAQRHHDLAVFEEIEHEEGKVFFFQQPFHRIKSKLRPWYILISFAVFLGIVIAPTPAGLTVEGQRAIAIFVLCILFWVANAIPLVITSLLAIVLLPLLGVMSSPDSFALFGNQAVFFILGAFILASAVMQSGLSTRIALKLLSLFGKDNRRLLAGVLLLPALLSFVMAAHAVAAMMYPIVVEMITALKLKKGHRYGAALMLALAWGAIIGGIATFLGGARAVLAVGILEETAGVTIGFLPWMLSALPAVFVAMIVAMGLLLWIIRKDKTDVHIAVESLQQKVDTMDALSYEEKGVSVLMISTIIAWVFFGQELGLATIALTAVAVAFIFKLMSWKQVEADVNWGIIFMYGGAIALGFALSESGAAAWIADVFISNWIASASALLLMLMVMSKVFTEGMSNTAVIALLMPIGVALAAQYGIDPKIVTLAITLPAGLAFILPISTPATAIAISSGYVTTRDTMWSGIVLHVITAIILFASAVLFWPAIVS